MKVAIDYIYDLSISFVQVLDIFPVDNLYVVLVSGDWGVAHLGVGLFISLEALHWWFAETDCSILGLLKSHGNNWAIVTCDCCVY